MVDAKGFFIGTCQYNFGTSPHAQCALCLLYTSRVLADELFAKYKFDYVVNFAAESHVDRSIENPQLFLMTNILRCV